MAAEGSQVDGVFAKKSDMTQQGQVFAGHLCSPRGREGGQNAPIRYLALGSIYKTLLQAAKTVTKS